MSTRTRILLMVSTTLGVFLLTGISLFDLQEQAHAGRRAIAKDNDWFMLQRVFPHDDLSPRHYTGARHNVRRMAAASSAGSMVNWQPSGPSNVGGRITSLALDPADQNTMYAGAAAGGIWKTTDGALTWTNVFNHSPSTGSLLLHPSNPDIIYVGTGEGNPGGVAIYPGDGIWRSTDGGGTWNNLGLNEVGHIGRIAIHPGMPDRIFAAAQGMYRSRTGERGVYRSTDAGATWERVHFMNDTTGSCEVLIDPANPDRILAAMWTRYRPITYSVITSENTSLWLSTDGGTNWTPVTNGFPFNDPALGRIRLAAAPSDPSVIYALASSGTGVRGIFRSSDAGVTWTQTATGSSFSGGEGQVWYNNIIAVHPANPNTLFSGMTSMYRSTNGGVNWSSITGTMHVDQHAIVFDQANPDRVIVGNDGGVFLTTNLGTSWTKSPNLPVSQFYAGTIDDTNPQRIYGGMQDNGTARTMTGGIDDWEDIWGGDGFYVLVDPTNPNRIYAESQNGGLVYSVNGGASFSNGRTGISASDRKNWCTPFAMDPSNPLTLYTGTHRMYRTRNGMQNWIAISADLTRGANGRLGTITTIDVSASDSNIVYVGTDDGKVSVTTNGGSTWLDVTGSLPIRWVTRVAVDPDSAHVAYVTHSGYLEYAFAPHIHRTTDFGISWTRISGNLPDMPINDVIVDPVFRPNLYIATDFGVMYSTNAGTVWQVLGNDFPEAPVHDLTLHSPTRKLTAFTHGRSAFSADLSGLVAVSLDAPVLPAHHQLYQNFPNPFNPTTEIRFDLSSDTPVKLIIYDIRGQEVITLIDGALRAGRHVHQFDATRLATGTYVCTLQAGHESYTQKMILAK